MDQQTEESRLPSPVGVGTLQSVEGWGRTKGQRKVEIRPFLSALFLERGISSDFKVLNFKLYVPLISF